MDKQEKKQKIIDLISDGIYKPMKKKELAILMQVPQEEKANFNGLIEELIAEGKIIFTKLGKIVKPQNLGLISGTFTGNAKGFGFVTVDISADSNNTNDIFIPPTHTNGAMHKDKVFCEIISESDGHMRREGRIVSIIKPGFDVIVGTYDKRKGYGLVIPDEKKIGEYIYVAGNRSKGAVSGHKVVVKLDSKAANGEYAKGFVTEIIGHKNDPGVDVLSIAKQFEIRTEFDNKINVELDEIQDEITEDDIVGRTDLRNEIMLTIDGEDTKDIDDAVSLTKLPNGNYKLGVHIADVSHYVRENTELDREAYKRGTSVYLADRVIPMLPHKLSNGICSLNKNTDRLALSCLMEITDKGSVVGSEIRSTVINVKRQITYTELNDMLTLGKSESFMSDCCDTDEYIPLFKNMEELAGILREKRVRRGAIEFDFPEAKIIVDNDGWPTDIKQYSRNVATGIIEEFMLACNETIAETFFWLETPFVYRTHEEPDEDKIATLADFVRNFGYSLRKSSMRPGSIQGLLSRVENSPEESVINRVVLRSLKQARYTPQNIGHFGLAAKYYCHFTSPIRRYPDLQIHRIIKEHLFGGISNNRNEFLSGIMPEVCRQCSTTERIAESTEREVDKLKKAQYMSDKIGDEFDGIISGLSAWGIYVMLPNTVEGMISKDTLYDDKYIYNHELVQYEGQGTGRIITLGEKLRIRLTRVNIDDRVIDFELA